MTPQAPSVAGFLLLFAVMWISVTTLLGYISGWPALAKQFPDRPEAASLKANGQSGAMGVFPVSMNGILNLSVCPSGLRIGISRVFGPFSPPFFVPWREIRVERASRFYGERAVLYFGGGRLTIAAFLADRLARASRGNWPEPGPFPAETPYEAFKAVFREWVLTTGFASAFFIIAPRLSGAGENAPPIAVAVLFPGFVFGLASVVRYFRRMAA
jgi:hypothetical protein